MSRVSPAGTPATGVWRGVLSLSEMSGGVPAVVAKLRRGAQDAARAEVTVLGCNSAN